MKIRELFETITPECYFNYTLRVEKLFTTADQLLESVPKGKWEDLADSISPRLKCEWFLHNTVEYVAKNPTPQELGSFEWFQMIKTKLEEGANKLLKPTIWSFDKKNSYAELDCYGIPTSLIDYETINLILNTRSISLSGIHKMIGKNCKVLGISNTDFIKGNVLSLLKLPKMCQIEWKLKQPWVKIVDSYLTRDRNIIACQEELFKHGLDEYAKL